MSNLDYKAGIIKSQGLYLIKAKKRRNNEELTGHQRIYFIVCSQARPVCSTLPI